MPRPHCHCQFITEPDKCTFGLNEIYMKFNWLLCFSFWHFVLFTYNIFFHPISFNFLSRLFFINLCSSDRESESDFEFWILNLDSPWVPIFNHLAFTFFSHFVSFTSMFSWHCIIYWINNLNESIMGNVNPRYSFMQRNGTKHCKQSTKKNIWISLIFCSLSLSSTTPFPLSLSLCFLNASM